MAASAEHCVGIGDVFDDIQGEDDVERSPRRQRLEPAEMDTAPPPPALPDDNRIGLDSLDMPELLEGIEEEPCPAPDVENTRIARPRAQERSNRVEQNALPHSPPPVAAVQVGIGGRVQRLHQSPPMTRATT